MDNDSMDSDSMVDKVGRMGRTDKLEKMGIENVGVVFYDVFHNCHNRIHSHHHHIDRNQIVSIFFLLLNSI